MIRGLHHVTATVDGAQEDVDFFRTVLGLRLVKKTVNFDNPQVYHLYYGTGEGAPGTLMTTFPYRSWGVPIGTHGNGQITDTRFAIPTGSAAFWVGRLEEARRTPVKGETAFGEAAVTVSDSSGLRIQLVEAQDSRPPWVTDDVSSEHGITGLHSVSFPVADVTPSVAFLETHLGWEVAKTSDTVTRVSVDSGGPGKWMDLAATPDGKPGVNGTGTVHHVAMAVDSDAVQGDFRNRLLEAEVRVTPVKDRQYFRSIYFREPGGVLFEIATIPPGFATDETVEELGTELKLPPSEEDNRRELQWGLPTLT